MSQSGEAISGGDSDSTDQFLRAQLAITPSSDSNCAVVDDGSDASEVTQHLKTTRPKSQALTDEQPAAVECTECHTEVTLDESDGERRYITSSVTPECICPVFETHDCIPRIKSVRDGAIVMVVTVPNRENLRAIISDLHSTEASFTVDWLVRGSEADATTEIDVSSITDKQREALELAKESGYYETPRQTSLSDLADELDISESAASQRLNGAETKLVRSFLDE